MTSHEYALRHSEEPTLSDALGMCSNWSHMFELSNCLLCKRQYLSDMKIAQMFPSDEFWKESSVYWCQKFLAGLKKLEALDGNL